MAVSVPQPNCPVSFVFIHPPCSAPHFTAPAHLPCMLLVSSAPLPPPVPLMRQSKLFPLSTFRYYICEAQRSLCYYDYHR
jgi:hypothetical protein